MMKVATSAGGVNSLKPEQLPPSGKHPEPEDLGEAAARFLDLLGEAGSGEVGNRHEVETVALHRGGDALYGAGEPGPPDEHRGVSVLPQSASHDAPAEEQPQVCRDAVLAQVASLSTTEGPILAEPFSHPASSTEPLPEPIRHMGEQIVIEVSTTGVQNEPAFGEVGDRREGEALALHRGGDALYGAGEPGSGDELRGVSAPPQSADRGAPEEEEQLQVRGDAVLAQMASLSTTEAPILAEPFSRPASSTEPLPEPIRNMVERILVEVPESTSRNEVRLHLSTEVLAGTNIRIFRDRGELIIQFLTESNDVQDFLLPHLASLQEHLEARQGEPVAVSVQYLGQSHEGQSEGRSRQRRTGWEVYEDGKKGLEFP